MSDESRVDARAFGALEAEVRHLREKIEAQAGLMRDMSRDQRALTELLAEARGGWRVIVFVAGFAGAAGAFLSKLPAWWNAR